MDQTTVQAGSQTGAVEDTKQAAQQAADKAQEKAQDLAGQARDQFRRQVDDRSTDAGLKLGETASDLRSVGTQLRQQDKAGAAKVAYQAADRAERVGDYLTRSGPDQILRDAEQFGRQRPGAVIAGGLLLGLAAARLLKASSRDRYSYERYSRPQLPAARTPSNGHSDNPVGSAGRSAPAPGAH
jgi:hypothetical protein